MSANQPLKATILILLALLLLCYSVSNIQCSTVHENSTDMLSLLDFKHAITNDPRGVLNNWNGTTPFCRWKGVTCSARLGRVMQLDFAGQGLTGEISPSLGNLTFLSTLNLSTNFFSGQLPPLNHLEYLETLDLSMNSLHGSIPDALTNCSSLSLLYLIGNSLSGAIPRKIGSLSRLQDLQLSRNHLTGIIPPTIINITDLGVLFLSSNQLEGSISSVLGQLSGSGIQYLSLAANRLLGTIPEVNLSSLVGLDLGTNMLHKTLPPNIGDILPNLIYLSLQNNMFEGDIPPSLGNVSSLRTLDLSQNNFSGQVPSFFGRFSNLHSLLLEKNKLQAKDDQSWEFMHALRNCSNLQILSIYDNQLEGAIPNSVGTLSTTTLTLLALATNNLSGTLPTSIGNLTSLTTLAIGHNGLTGPIEEWIGKLKNLEALYLNDNHFVGSIPSSIGNLTSLIKLRLEQNELEGPIPLGLGKLARLSDLNLSHNNLQGKVPEEIFRKASTMTTCALSNNHLEGPIPDFGNLRQLSELHLSSNKLTGEIPATLGNCQGLEMLQMDNNFLTGNIPILLSNLKSLRVLNLSHNNLSGSIPFVLSDLQYLTQLDLSYNLLQGEIPRNGVFGNATAVSLGDNSGLCGGVLDLRMPSCHSVSRRTERRYYLIKVLIPIFGFMSLMLVIYFLLAENRMAGASYTSMPLFGKKFPKLSYKELAQATNDFSESNLLGRGSYGSVYRGKLTQDKLEVAVKVLDLDMRGAERSFVSECQALRGIQHRNLLPIITTCSTVDNKGCAFKALVYKYMPKGNLDTWLHHKRDGKASEFLGLTQRLSIAVNIADALDYIHHDSGKPVIHCDVKPSNILLDDDMNAHLGDFGIASFFLSSRSTSTGDPNASIGVKGTIGYIAPEYAGGARASTCGDVYSYGVLLLEMLLGKRPTDPMFENGLNIVNFVEQNFPDHILHIVDGHLQEECKKFARANVVTENAVYQCLLSLLQVALSCTRQFPRERIDMREAATKIRDIQTSYVRGKAKHGG